MSRSLHVVLVVAFLAAGVGAAAWLVASRPKPPRVEPAVVATPVEVVTVRPEPQRMVVQAMGTVRPARDVALFPEVQGRVVDQSPNLLPGGCVKAGEVLVRLDARPYALVAEQQKAAVARALFDLKVEEGRQAVARREWSLVGTTAATGSADLVLRTPHLENARAALEGARGALGRAELDVERATIRAPFNGQVLEEAVELGQVVGPQSRLARIVGTDQVWVQVSVPQDRLPYLSIPTTNASTGSTAVVVQDLGGGATYAYRGRVLRLFGDVEPAGRMARLLLAVDEPSCPCATSRGAALPLLVGAFVRVELEGPLLPVAVALPTTALREGSSVYVVGTGDVLEVRPVDVAFARDDTVVVRSGLAAGERVVVSRLGVAVAGMPLAVEGGAR